MCRLLPINSLNDVLPTDWTKRYAYEVPRQADTSSCGPICCYVFLLKVRNKFDGTSVNKAKRIRN